MTILAVLFILTGFGWIVKTELGYRKGRQEYQKAQDRFVTIDAKIEIQDERISEAELTKTETLELPDDAPELLNIDFDGLHEINDDVVAWIDIPAVGISYPVMQAEDNSTYLHKGLEGDYLFAGSIFMDQFNDPELSNMNTIIYGHNMNDRSMFGRLRDFMDLNTIMICPYFCIYTPRGCFIYKIMSVHRAGNGTSTYQLRFQDAEQFKKWLKDMKLSSAVELHIEPDIIDQIVTLSTCTGDSSEKQVVQGVLLATIEDGTVTELRKHLLNRESAL